MNTPLVLPRGSCNQRWMECFLYHLEHCDQLHHRFAVNPQHGPGAVWDPPVGLVGHGDFGGSAIRFW